jgi:hypothetical protein
MPPQTSQYRPAYPNHLPLLALQEPRFSGQRLLRQMFQFHYYRDETCGKRLRLRRDQSARWKWDTLLSTCTKRGLGHIATQSLRWRKDGGRPMRRSWENSERSATFHSSIGNFGERPSGFQSCALRYSRPQQEPTSLADKAMAEESRSEKLKRIYHE